MWRGYEGALMLYGLFVVIEWEKRGFKDTVMEKLLALKEYDDFHMFPIMENMNGTDPKRPVFRFQCNLPPWLGDPAFHAAMKSNLIRKDPIHYGKFGWKEPNNLPYIWPVVESPQETRMVVV